MKTIKLKSLLLFLVLFCISDVFAQIPDRPNVQKLVNDFTNTLSEEQASALETKLRSYHDTTSTQILVVLVNSLEGYAPSDYTIQLAEKWGVGQKEKDNGVVILVKPKTSRSNGQAFIATGYGLEAYIPDALAKRIVENEMIPAFKNNDYYSGINKAVDVIIGLASGAFTAEEYGNSSGVSLFFSVIIFFIILIAIISMGSHKDISGKGGSGSRGNSLLSAILLSSMMNSGSRSSGGWGGGSSGGGFGGFGGGSFGGGGAGGSW